MIKKVKLSILVSILSIACVLFSACSRKGEAADPSLWGYNCTVTYDALGGRINARETRTTYYLPNSYVFEPSGSSNMLVAPTRDGYILAGWYTAKSEPAEGSLEEYTFDPSDRLDFDIDRVQDDMTLYARWLPRGKVDYVNADTGEVLFSKNITSESPIQPLSDSVITLKTPKGNTFSGYYDDAACTTEYDFSTYMHVDPTPTEETLYAQLYQMFPQYIEKAEYVALSDDETDSNTDTSWLFMNKLGYRLLTTDESALAEIRAAKDQIIETAIQDYLVNTANRVVYLKFTEGNYVMVNDAADLKMGTKYGFFDTDMAGDPITGYIFDADVDLSGITITMSDSFSGVINGNGHKLTNLNIAVSSRKIDTDEEKTVGLTARMDGATINDLTIENAALTLQVNSGIKVTGGLLAAQAKNVTFNNCHFNGLTITGGKGDDGTAKYVLGDLFGSFENCTFNDCTADGLVADVAKPDKLVLAIFQLPSDEETPADGTNDTTTP